MTIITDPNQYVKGYEYTREEDSKIIPIEKEDVIHWKKPSPLETHFGASPLAAAAMRVDTEEFATRYQRDFFLNNARIDAVLESPNILNDRQIKQIKKEWEKKYKGVGKNSKIAILGSGVKYQQIAISQKEMDYIESLKFTRDDILVAFKTPKPVVAVTDDVNRANADTAMTIFLSETIKPEISGFIEKINEEMTYEDFGDDLFLTFTDPTPENRDAKLLEYANGLQNNWLLINEVRQRENLPPIKGGWTLYLNPLLYPAGGLPEKNAIKDMDIVDADWREKAKINAEQKMKVFNGKMFLKLRLQTKEEIKNALSDVYNIKKLGKKIKKGTKAIKGKIVRFIKQEVRNEYAEVVNKKIEEMSPRLKKAMVLFASEQKDRFFRRLNKAKAIEEKAITVSVVKRAFNKKKEDQLLAEFSFPFLAELAKEAGEDALDMIAPAEDFSVAKMEKVLRKRAEMLADSVNGTTLESLTGTIAEGIDAGEGIGEMTDRIQSVYSDLSDYRAERIARTETTASNNEGFIEAYKQSGVATHKEWIAVMDERTRPEHAALNGEVVPLDSKFSNNLTYPQEPNCRCVIGPVFKED
jgi:HK97 family phage portal protein